MKTKINTKVDTTEAENELANAKKQLRQFVGTKDKIIINVMAELIIKYRNKVDWDSLPDVKMPELKE